MKIVSTLIARLADMIEFEGALVASLQGEKLAKEKVAMGYDQTDRFADRVRKAYNASCAGDWTLARDLPWHDATQEVMARQQRRVRLLAHRRAEQLAREEERALFAA